MQLADGAEVKRNRFAVVVHTVLPGADGVYLLRRAESLAYGGLYTLPGGYLEAGEGLYDAAVRETREETGVEVVSGRFVGVLSYRARGQPKADQQGLNIIFVADEYHGKPQVMEPDKFSSGGLFSADCLPQPCVPWLPDALDMALGARSGELIEHIWD